MLSPIRTQFRYDRYRVRNEVCTGIVRVAAAWERGSVQSGNPGERDESNRSSTRRSIAHRAIAGTAVENQTESVELRSQ